MSWNTLAQHVLTSLPTGIVERRRVLHALAVCAPPDLEEAVVARESLGALDRHLLLQRELALGPELAEAVPVGGRGSGRLGDRPLVRGSGRLGDGPQIRGGEKGGAA